jgi:hypothetical protein
MMLRIPHLDKLLGDADAVSLEYTWNSKVLDPVEGRAIEAEGV